MYIKWNWKLILQVRHTVSLGLQLESIFHISPNRTIQMPFDVCRWVLRASKSLSTLATLSKRWHVWCRHPEWTGELSVQMSHRILGESLRDQWGYGVQRIAMPQQWQMCSQVAARVRVQMSRRILWWVLQIFMPIIKSDTFQPKYWPFFSFAFVFSLPPSFDRTRLSHYSGCNNTPIMQARTARRRICAHHRLARMAAHVQLWQTDLASNVPAPSASWAQRAPRTFTSAWTIRASMAEHVWTITDLISE